MIRADDRRITYASVCGGEYPLCLTVKAHQKIIDTYGGLKELANAMKGETSVQKGAWLAHTLMEGGAARVKALAFLEGEETPECKVPPLEVLEDAMDLKEVNALAPKLFEAIRVSRGVTVETEPQQEQEDNTKNADATQGSI